MGCAGPADASAASLSSPSCENPAVLNVLIVTFPFFALVLAGFVAAKRRMLPLEAIPGLNGFVLFFALPAMLYRFGSTTPIAELLDASVFGVYLLLHNGIVMGITVMHYQMTYDGGEDKRMPLFEASEYETAGEEINIAPPVSAAPIGLIHRPKQ